jgi:NADH-quinone oxidoreductase subunit G
LANLLDMPDSHYLSSHEVRDDLRAIAGDLAPHNSLPADARPGMGPSAEVPRQQLDVPLYRIDPLVRRAQSLQLTRDGRQAQTGGRPAE